MIVKIKLSEYQHEVFQIAGYYTEDEPPYIEVDFDCLNSINDQDYKGNIDHRKILLAENLYLGEMEEWEEIQILTDAGFELIKCIKEEE